MLRYYHVDIDDLRRGHLTPRRVAALIGALPADSATGRAIHGPDAGWALTDHLLAMVIDRLAVMSWQLQGDPKKPYPTPLPRPGVADQTIRHGRATRSRNEIVVYLRRFAPPREEVINDG